MGNKAGVLQELSPIERPSNMYVTLVLLVFMYLVIFYMFVIIVILLDCMTRFKIPVTGYKEINVYQSINQIELRLASGSSKLNRAINKSSQVDSRARL